MKRALAVGTHQRALPLAIDVRAVLKTLDRHKPFDEQFRKLDEKAALGEADDERVELIAKALRHEAHFLPFHQLALGILSAPLGFGGGGRERRQFLRMDKGAAGSQRIARSANRCG